MDALRGPWKSAITEHQWDQQHRVDWVKWDRVLDRSTRPVQLKVQHYTQTANNRLKHDRSYELYQDARS